MLEQKLYDTLTKLQIEFEKVEHEAFATCEASEDFYQKNNFSASDHVEKLVPKFDMNAYIALFIKTIIELEKTRYGYGRKFSQTRIKQTKINGPPLLTNSAINPSLTLTTLKLSQALINSFFAFIN